LDQQVGSNGQDMTLIDTVASVEGPTIHDDYQWMHTHIGNLDPMERKVLRMRFATVLSQRNANNNFLVMLADLIGSGLAITINSAVSITVAIPGHTYTSQSVGQFMYIGGIVGAAGIPGRYAIASVVAGVSVNFTVAGWPASGSCTATLFGHSFAKVHFTGATATNALVTTQRKGWADADTTATINTTASPGTIVHMELTGRECFWYDTLRASGTAPTVTQRAFRYESLPDDNQHLSFIQGSGHGGSHPHLVHEFVSALAEGRSPYPNAAQSANITCVGILAHESAMEGGKIKYLPEFTHR
jgi:hypothetical protein